MADQRADQEKGAVLIAVNSYWNNPEHCLLYSDRVLKGYIETFYRYLFFQVDVVVDFTLVDFIGKLNEFTTGCRNNGMNRIAVVLYGHGGIDNGKEYIFTSDFKSLDIAALEEELQKQLPDDNKYLFIDACRNSVSVQPQPYVFQAKTSRTTVIRSTLLFKMAISNAWSECFAMNLRKQGALAIIVNNVNDNMKEKYTDDIRRKCNIPVNEGNQKSEIHSKGASDDPSFRGEASASNQERIRELTPYLQGLINVAKKSMAEMRAKLGLPPEPILSFLGSPADDRSNLTGPGLALSSAQAIDYTIVVIGVTGRGKSTFCNFFCNDNFFDESMMSCDSPVNFRDFTLPFGMESYIRLVDTTGYLSTDSISDHHTEPIREAILKNLVDSIKICKNGVDVFFLAVRADTRVTMEERHMYDFVDDFNLWSHCIVLITCSDGYKFSGSEGERHEGFREWMLTPAGKKNCPVLVDLIKRCSWRFVMVESTKRAKPTKLTEHKRYHHDKLKEILVAVDELYKKDSELKPYDHQLFKKAREAHDSKEELEKQLRLHIIKMAEETDALKMQLAQHSQGDTSASPNVVTAIQPAPSQPEQCSSNVPDQCGSSESINSSERLLPRKRHQKKCNIF